MGILFDHTTCSRIIQGIVFIKIHTYIHAETSLTILIHRHNVWKVSDIYRLTRVHINKPNRFQMKRASREREENNLGRMACARKKRPVDLVSISGKLMVINLPQPQIGAQTDQFCILSRCILLHGMNNVFIRDSLR